MVSRKEYFFMDELKPSYFSILTADVRYDKDLSASEKIFYSEITCLCNSKGFCYCSNKYFSELYNKDIRTIQLWLNKLVLKNYIKIDYDSKTSERKIYIIIKSNQTILQENKKKELKRRERSSNVVHDFYNSIN